MSWLAVALLGGVVGLDATSFPQIMISRPLVAASLTGLLLGHPGIGVAVGVLLEASALLILPVGAARYPEAGTAAIAATAAHIQSGAAVPDPVLLLFAVLVGLGWERLAGLAVHQVRRLNERVVGNVLDHTPAAAPRQLERRHLLAMGLDLLRGAAVTLAGAAVGVALLRHLSGLWELEGSWAVGTLAVTGTAMLAATLPLFGGWGERRIAVLLGLLCGSILLLVR
ncbi:MAG: PTS sugar transporter subunit IIC [Gemmatimonadetes bacterium]|nr:PTS sugar transporter subunit IIC [Gemmatimonadota bacterium]